MTEDHALCVAKRLAEAIGAATIESRPSENFYIEDAFAPEVFQEILARLPADEALDDIRHPDAVAPDGRVTRKLLDFTEQSLERLDAADREFWRGLTQALTSQTLLNALAAKFRVTLETQYGADRPAMTAVPLLYRDLPGYRIGVHPDAATKIATLQFYLPADDSQVHLGTTFHERTPDGFQELKTNPFKPNSAYGFVRTDESWHSVKELGPDEAIRNSLALTVYHRGLQYSSAM
ncbi:hypothetical protein [Phenylobacterium sp.]|uniref:hypothetical protein n=1 Tax=Phenylobacterium sp. TaxID=1871053 RepID=UPI002736B7AD|nr:hypothetical protein [Phenylobacterium sp.]MDP3659813.1 hypothetical protein [Phenylobacterium sp.]